MHSQQEWKNLEKKRKSQAKDRTQFFLEWFSVNLILWHLKRKAWKIFTSSKAYGEVWRDFVIWTAWWEERGTSPDIIGLILLLKGKALPSVQPIQSSGAGQSFPHLPHSLETRSASLTAAQRHSVLLQQCHLMVQFPIKAVRDIVRELSVTTEICAQFPLFTSSEPSCPRSWTTNKTSQKQGAQRVLS